MNWSDDRVELLKKLWIDGHSASQIAKQLGGVTRNAVIGKVHRLGLAGRATPSRPIKRIVRPRPVLVAESQNEAKSVEKPKSKPVNNIDTVETGVQEVAAQSTYTHSGDLISVLDLGPNMCKWPIGDPTDPEFGFCGAKTHGNWPYCEHHGVLAYQPQVSKKGAATSESVENANRNAG